MTEFEHNLKYSDARFYINLAEGDTTTLNGTLILSEEYRLVISKRDFNLFAVGMKPYGGWSFNAAKKYYGLTGNAEVVKNKFQKMYEDFKEWKESNLIGTEK